MEDPTNPVRHPPEKLDISTKHFALAEKHLHDDLDESTLILKTHLLLEELLRDFCESSVSNPKYFRDARLTFKQVLLLVRSMAPVQSHPSEWVWGSIGHLNTMRNLMAHAIEPDEVKYGNCRTAIMQAVNSAFPGPGAEAPDFHESLAYVYGLIGGLLQGFLDARDLWHRARAK